MKKTVLAAVAIFGFAAVICMAGAAPLLAADKDNQHQKFLELKKKAENGDAHAQSELSAWYPAYGHEPQDPVETVKWFRKAAEQGDADGQFRLGLMYYEGKGVSQSHTEAMKWFRKAAEQGNTDALTRVATMHYKGEGVPKNPVEAVKWFRKAAEHGGVQARKQLATIYYYGFDGVPKDYKEAMKLYRTLAEPLDEASLFSRYFGGGDADAQVALGTMYDEGKGSLQDHIEAVKWFRLAAEQGNARGQFRLGTSYYEGKGVPQDYIEAYAWANSSAAHGNESASKLRDHIANKLTPTDLSKAQQRAQEYFKKYRVQQ